MFHATLLGGYITWREGTEKLDVLQTNMNQSETGSIFSHVFLPLLLLWLKSIYLGFFSRKDISNTSYEQPI